MNQNRPTINSDIRQQHITSEAQLAPAFIPLTEDEARIVRLLALGHPLEQMSQLTQCELNELIARLQKLARRAARYPAP